MVWMGAGVGLLTSAISFADMPSYRDGIAAEQTSLVWHDDFNEGWQESRRRGVPMMIYITSDDCQYCEAMKRDTWCDESIREQLADGFVAIRLTPRNNARVLDRIRIPAYPTTLIGVPQGKIIDHRVGYQPPGSMRKLLSRVRQR